MDFDDKVAIVTGASRGIGRAIALEFGGRGARVVVNYNQNSSAADKVVKTIMESGGEAFTHQADVSVFEQADGLVKAAIEEYGDLNILVNNAGITRDGLIMTMSESDWDQFKIDV